MMDQSIKDFIEKIRTVPDFPKPGIQFKDITPVLSDASLCKKLMQLLEKQWHSFEIETVVGIESRGFIFGMQLAQSLEVPFVPIRKAGKLPFHTYQMAYDLEYGQAIIEVHKDAFQQGCRVLVHDDLLATGGTAAAAAKLVELAGAQVVGFSFLIELGFLEGRAGLPAASEVQSLVTF